MPFFRSSAESNQQEISLGVDHQRDSGHQHRRLVLRDDYRPGESAHYIKPFEAYWQWKSESLFLSVGKKLENWSHADSLWGMGVWQSRFMDDPIVREQGGLTGIFAEAPTALGRIRILASPLFVPDLGPQVRVVDSQVESRNPWLRSPPRQAILNGQRTDLRYTIMQPDIASIAQRWSLVTAWNWEGANGNFIQASFARKPLNTLLLAAPISLSVASPIFASIDIHVRVLEHEVASLEWGRRQIGGWHYWLSGTIERPTRDQTPASWTTQQAVSAQILSAYLGRDLDERGQRKAFVSIWNLEGGDAPDTGQVTAETRFFARRFLFQRAIQFGLEWPTQLWRSARLGSLTGRFTYDDRQRGVLGSLQVAQPLSSKLSMTAVFDVLGLVSLNAPVRDGFLSDFRANDRLSLGATYVF